jgi:hypothetical protein
VLSAVWYRVDRLLVPVNSKWASGDISGAQIASGKARKFAIWAALAAVVWVVLSLVLIFGLHTTGARTAIG